MSCKAYFRRAVHYFKLYIRIGAGLVSHENTVLQIAMPGQIRMYNLK